MAAKYTCDVCGEAIQPGRARQVGHRDMESKRDVHYEADLCPNCCAKLMLRLQHGLLVLPDRKAGIIMPAWDEAVDGPAPYFVRWRSVDNYKP